MKPYGPWKIGSQDVLYQDQWLTLRKDTGLRPDGKPGTHTVTSVNRGVSILPIDNDGSIYLAKQFAYALGKYSLECASGSIEPGESPRVAACRELREELGIIAKDLVSLGEADAMTNMFDAHEHLFMARGLTCKQQCLEGTESIQIVRLPLEEAVEKVMRSEITSAISSTLILKAHRLWEQESQSQYEVSNKGISSYPDHPS